VFTLVLLMNQALFFPTSIVDLSVKKEIFSFGFFVFLGFPSFAEIKAGVCFSCR